MSASLFEIVVTVDDREISRHPLGPGEYIAGSAEGCAIPIPHGSAARKFAKISIGQNGRVVVEDLASESGTLLDDLPIVVAGWTPGHMLRFGHVRLELWPVAGELLPAPVKAPAASPAPTARASLLDDDEGLIRPPSTPAAQGSAPTKESSVEVDDLVSARRTSARPRRMALWTLSIVGLVFAGLAVQHFVLKGGAAAPMSESAAAQASFLHAMELIEQGAFAEALGEIEVAISTQPGVANYYVVKGNILQSLGRLGDARDAYDLALQRDQGLRQARENRDLCEQIWQADQAGPLSPASRAKLAEAMRSQRRASEAKAMER